MDRHLAFPTFPELATKRLRLREITAADLDWYLDHFSTLEIVEGQGYPAPMDREGAAAELHRYVLDLFASRNGFRWGLALGSDPTLIGSIGLYKWIDQPRRQAEVGYDLAPARWGHGYMTESLAAVVDFGFEQMALERIEAFVMVRNDRSARLLERGGFVREATFRAHGEDEHGVLVDEYRYALER